MTTLPAWTNADWAGDIAEPFRSDGEFWAGLAASADALVSLAAAVAVAVVLVVGGAGIWAVVPFAAPAGLAIRAAVISTASSRRSREAFVDRHQWRDAERNAVAKAFIKVLRRPLGTAR